MKCKYYFLYLLSSVFVLVSSCKYDNKTDSIISIPFTIEDGRMVLEAAINGQQGRFIFDSAVMISNVDVSTWRLFPVAHTKRMLNGKLRRGLVYGLDKIYFGDIEVKANSYLMNRSDTITYLKEYEGYDGLLGMSVFEGYWCELSFSEQKIILHKEKPEGYNNHSPARLLNINSSIDIPITIDNEIVYMAVDTGLTDAVFFPEDVGKEKNANNAWEIISNEEVEQYHLVKTNEISILDETYNDKYIMTNSYSAKRRNYESHNDMGLIGLNFLKNYDLLFDYREIRKGKTTGIYYKPMIPSEDRDYGFFSFLDEVPVPGILNFWISNEGLTISSILTDGIAYTDYGLRPGDVITKINNRPIADFTKEEIVDPDFYKTITDFSILKNGSEIRIMFSP